MRIIIYCFYIIFTCYEKSTLNPMLVKHPSLLQFIVVTPRHCLPLFCRLRCSISAWSLCRVSWCCCCRNWMFLCREATRGSHSVSGHRCWASAALSSPLTAVWFRGIEVRGAGGGRGGGRGGGNCCLDGKDRGDKGFLRRPTRVHRGRWLRGGRLGLDISAVPLLSCLLNPLLLTMLAPKLSNIS